MKFDKETFELAFAHLNEKVRETSKELNKLIPRISDFDKLLTKSLATIGKLSGCGFLAIWGANEEYKKRYFRRGFSTTLGMR